MRNKINCPHCGYQATGTYYEEQQYVDLANNQLVIKQERLCNKCVKNYTVQNVYDIQLVSKNYVTDK